MKVERQGRSIILPPMENRALVLHRLFREFGALKSEGQDGARGPDVPVVVSFENSGDARRAARAAEETGA